MPRSRRASLMRAAIAEAPLAAAARLPRRAQTARLVLAIARGLRALLHLQLARAAGSRIVTQNFFYIRKSFLLQKKFLALRKQGDRCRAKRGIDSRCKLADRHRARARAWHAPHQLARARGRTAGATAPATLPLKTPQKTKTEGTPQPARPAAQPRPLPRRAPAPAGGTAAGPQPGAGAHPAKSTNRNEIAARFQKPQPKQRARSRRGVIF